MDSFNEDRIKHLLAKHLMRDLTEDESMELEKWRKLSTLNEDLYQRMSDPAYLEKRYSDFTKATYAAAKGKKSSGRIWWRWGLLAAAAVVLVALILPGFLRPQMKTDSQVIVVEALVHGTCGGAHPGAVFSLAEDSSAGAAETEAHDDGSGLGSVDLEAGEALGVHHRILLAGLVELGRLEVLDDLEFVHLGIEALDGEVALLRLHVLVEEEGIVRASSLSVFLSVI